MKKAQLAVRFNVEAVNEKADTFADYAGIERSKVIRAALVIGLKQLAAAPYTMSSDECYMMVHRGQDL